MLAPLRTRLRAYLSDRRLGQALHDGLAAVVDLYQRLNAIANATMLRDYRRFASGVKSFARDIMR